MRNTLRWNAVLLTTLLSMGVVQHAAAANSITIQQLSPMNQYGRIELIMPSSIATTRGQTQTYAGTSDGSYQLNVFPPQGATTDIQFMEQNTIVRTVHGTSTTFTLTGSTAVRIVVAYTYTGIVTVDSDPRGATFTLIGNDGTTTKGKTPATFTNLSPQLYAVQFDTVKDCRLPKQQSRVLESNGKINFYADYLCAGEIAAATPTPTAPMTDRSEEMNIRLWHSFNQSEAVPGTSVLVTIGVRNISKTTIKNLILTQAFDDAQVDMPAVLPHGGRLANKFITWDIPQIYAGQSWTATFPVTLKENLSAGTQVQLLAHVSGSDIRSPRAELLSETATVGIATMPATGTSMSAAAIALLLAGAAFISTYLIRRKSVVVQGA